MDPDTPVEETLDVLEDLRREGKILYGGSCNFSPVKTAEAAIAAARLGIEGFACLQPRYNLLHRHCEHAIFPLAEAEGIGVISYNPLAGGFLTAKHRGRRPDEDPPAGRFSLPGMSGNTYRRRYWNETMFEQSERIFAICDEAGLEPARVAVGWVLAQPAVTAPILGASSADQLDAVLPAFAEPLGDDLLAALDDATRDATLEWAQ
jgi:aryl-alcohol dehydrogenase (NADP+)